MDTTDTTDTTDELPDPVYCPRCLRLRTKMDYVSSIGRPSGRPSLPDEDPVRGGTAHKYYCTRTWTVFGPDDDMVGPKICTPDRMCYEEPEASGIGDQASG